ncbi:peptide chain release factor N(5)-glutamine methyltransferase [Cecembia calidifontis]|jgi:release factor glutamine methyltransferase|uniref:Release factor glutamine methyltransferase n=1 Tax=Cecembia calidifontis TaxID=1187080 RepID=A0A4Q7P642_9BACT|nr:peptide chain release factor N(5)-glutamine methyltransferase [Cecembia calidifontis]RZS95227.1 release factor glutamine methyltransferase [Cecembia calidifontis]
MISIRKLFKEYVDKLAGLYPLEEAESLVIWLFEEFLGKKRMDIIRDEQIEKLPEALQDALDQLLKGKPIQYILGTAPFYGREFEVSPAVLIPRNETEELVHLIIKENPGEGLRILDIGTGSGCIPITLSREMNHPQVFAVDISPEALEMAKRNAFVHHAAVDFRLLDILKEDIPFENLDIVVSNPPYVRYSEKEKMHQNVLEYEPHLALFVFDEDPLLFYREIALKAGKVLKQGGKLYFEINEALGLDTQKLMESLGYSQVRVLKDLNDRERMVVGLWIA